jgi:hypothetical protein
MKTPKRQETKYLDTARHTTQLRSSSRGQENREVSEWEKTKNLPSVEEPIEDAHLLHRVFVQQVNVLLEFRQKFYCQ